MLRHVLERAELMDRVMEHAGVDPAAAARADRGMAFYEARTRCLACRSEHRCREWLQSSEPLTPCPDFCPNAAFFRSVVGASDILPAPSEIVVPRRWPN
jgi:hypothetical protein